MAYNKTVWQDLPNTTTPINSTNLNKIETGIGDAHDNIGDLSSLTTTNKSDLVSAVNEVKDYVDTVTNYTITPTYAQAQDCSLKRVGKIVILNLPAIYLANISANTWTNIATIPTEIVNGIKTVPCTEFNTNNGNMIGYGRIELGTNGTLRVKASTTLSSEVGFCANIVWTL